jgi:hypothetical protein
MLGSVRYAASRGRIGNAPLATYQARRKLSIPHGTTFYHYRVVWSNAAPRILHHQLACSPYSCRSQAAILLVESFARAFFTSRHTSDALLALKPSTPSWLPPLTKCHSSHQGLGYRIQERSDGLHSLLQPSRHPFYAEAAPKRFPLNLLFTILRKGITERDRL